MAIKKVFDKDSLNSKEATNAVTIAYSLLDTMNGEAPELQTAATAFLFYAMCVHLKLDPSQLIDASQRRYKTLENQKSVTLEALQEFLKMELRGL